MTPLAPWRQTPRYLKPTRSRSHQSGSSARYDGPSSLTHRSRLAAWSLKLLGVAKQPGSIIIGGECAGQSSCPSGEVTCQGGLIG